MALPRSSIRCDSRWSSRPSLPASARCAAICPSNFANRVARVFCCSTSAAFWLDVSATSVWMSSRRASACPCSAASRAISSRNACTACARARDT
ncbi:Uncharacterised protein [Bordetella pertussis]|nr:Uncharacterised protein [Bordetella pertussis]